MMVRSLLKGWECLTDLNDFVYFWTHSKRSRGLVKISFCCPTVLNSFSRSARLMGFLLSSCSIYSSDSAFMILLLFIKE